MEPGPLLRGTGSIFAPKSHTPLFKISPPRLHLHSSNVEILPCEDVKEPKQKPGHFIHSLSMAGLIQKLLKKSSSLRTITTFSNPQPLKLPTIPLLLQQQPNPIDFKSNDPSFINPILGSPQTSLSSSSLQIYPSFPFGYYINPSSQTGEIINQMEKDEGGVVIDSGEEDASTIWADSVKRKRKKKMNKHKYKKLRKRLRRQT